MWHGGEAWAWCHAWLSGVSYRIHCSGATEHAFGALMRMAFAMVGAMRSTVAGVDTCSAFIPAP